MRGRHTWRAALLRARSRRDLAGPAARRTFKAAERLRNEAASTRDLQYALSLFLDVLRRTASRALRRRTRERVVLMLCQGVNGHDPAAAVSRHLRVGGFVCRLSDGILRYPTEEGPPPELSPRLPAPPRETAHAVDDALPAGMLRALQAAFAPASPFWSEHGYACGTSAFFSYVHPLDAPPRNGFDRVLAALAAIVRARFPRARAAKYVEWWAHCRPHGVGHQLHFDSHDEGRGGVRNPLVSSAFYLTPSSIGGPTLVTAQRLGEPLSPRGWLAMPDTNRYLMFDGRLLHGVVPGRGACTHAIADAGADGAGKRSREERAPAPPPPPSRRVSLMVAFWPSIEQRAPTSGAPPSAAMPFPYEEVQETCRTTAGGGGGGGGGDARGGGGRAWPALFDWPESADEGGGSPAAPAERSLRAVEGSVWAHAALPSGDAVDGGAGSMAESSLFRLESMPEYERCFQGLC